MDKLLARFFDGDFDDREAQAFLEAVESNPALEKELRAYERVLSLGQQLPAPRAPAGFTRRVMGDVKAEKRSSGGWLRVLWPRWAPAVAVAAVVIAFLGGRWTVPVPTGGPETQTASPEALTVFTGEATAAAGYRTARLVYLPGDTSVERVEVAGTFNGWDPSTTPMQKQDGVWRTVLILPPGNYEYMFVVDGERWITDPLAVATHDDGFGGANAVLDLSL